MNIPEPAINAAAEALATMYSNGEFAAIYREDAVTALDAAMPAIREALAQEIMHSPASVSVQWTAGMRRHAARIVRGV